jgi:hypothetical protein
MGGKRRRVLEAGAGSGGGLLACVLWRAPGFAADLFAGSPSLGPAAIVHNVGAAATMTAGAVMQGVGATRSAVAAVQRSPIPLA